MKTKNERIEIIDLKISSLDKSIGFYNMKYSANIRIKELQDKTIYLEAYLYLNLYPKYEIDELIQLIIDDIPIELEKQEDEVNEIIEKFKNL